MRLGSGSTERLWGVVESMAVLRSRRDGGRDALLLTFRCVKTCTRIPVRMRIEARLQSQCDGDHDALLITFKSVCYAIKSA